MTNHEIILRESIRLMQEGILAGSGIFATIPGADGDGQRIELPESIHTFAAWKAAGFVVKRGEHAVAAFPVWKYTERRQAAGDDGDNADADGDNAPGGKMYLRKAFFFKRSQVEKITA